MGRATKAADRYAAALDRVIERQGTVAQGASTIGEGFDDGRSFEAGGDGGGMTAQDLRALLMQGVRGPNRPPLIGPKLPSTAGVFLQDTSGAASGVSSTEGAAGGSHVLGESSLRAQERGPSPERRYQAYMAAARAAGFQASQLPSYQEWLRRGQPSGESFSFGGAFDTNSLPGLGRGRGRVGGQGRFGDGNSSGPAFYGEPRTQRNNPRVYIPGRGDSFPVRDDSTAAAVNSLHSTIKRNGGIL